MIDGRAVLLVGDSWAGKSSLTAFALIMGHRVVHDGLVWVDRRGLVRGDGGPICLRAGGWRAVEAELKTCGHLPDMGLRIYSFGDGALLQARRPLRPTHFVKVDAVVFVQFRPYGDTELRAVRFPDAVHLLQSICRSRGGVEYGEGMFEPGNAILHNAQRLYAIAYGDAKDALQQLGNDLRTLTR